MVELYYMIFKSSQIIYMIAHSISIYFIKLSGYIHNQYANHTYVNSMHFFKNCCMKSELFSIIFSGCGLRYGTRCS